MARAVWVAITAALLVFAPSTIAEEGCTVAITIPVVQPGSATLGMVCINYSCAFAQGLEATHASLQLQSCLPVLHMAAASYSAGVYALCLSVNNLLLPRRTGYLCGLHDVVGRMRKL